MKYLYKILSLCLIITAWFARPLCAQNLDSLVTYCLSFAGDQLANSATGIGDSTHSPYYTWPDGSWRTNRAPSWVSGWFPGCLWYMYQYTSDDVFKKWAEKWTSPLEIVKTYTNTHDVGFMVFCSFGNGYRLTGSEKYKETIIEAAGSMTALYNSTIGCFKPKGSDPDLRIMIDTMMNLELLLWASKHGGEPEWKDMVVNHALKSSEDLLREDGGTFQDAYYDPDSGAVIRQTNHQGHADSSTWARGHAWGLYGFTMVYRETNDDRFLSTAENLADYFIENLPEDQVPFWDFDLIDTYKDVSAAAIALSGLLELSTLVPDQESAIKYWDAAIDILKSLCSSAYLAEGSVSSGILLHGVQNYNKDKGLDATLIYADYYFIEALLRYLEITGSGVTVKNQNVAVPHTIRLGQNYPNPFNSSTRFSYSIPQPGFVTLTVYDILGREIQTVIHKFQSAGTYSVRFDAGKFSSGVYYYQLRTGDFEATKKMLFLQ